MTATARYYETFRMHHGFADSAMRGHELSRVIVSTPYSDAKPGEMADKYCETRLPKRGKYFIAYAMDARQKEIDTIFASLRALVGHVRGRIETRGGCAAAREALSDAQAIVVGKPPKAPGDRLEVLRSLVRVLQRYA